MITKGMLGPHVRIAVQVESFGEKLTVHARDAHHLPRNRAMRVRCGHKDHIGYAGSWDQFSEKEQDLEKAQLCLSCFGGDEQ